MRPPSTELLRALRRAATAPPAAPRAQCPRALTARRTCLSQLQPHHQLPLRGTTRAFSSSPRPSSPTTPTLTPSPPTHQHSNLHTPSKRNPNAPRTSFRGPASKEDTQTDFSKMDILASSGVEAPATSIDACTADGFHLNNGIQTSGGKGVLLVGGEAFIWSPWNENIGSDSTGTPTGGVAAKGGHGLQQGTSPSFDRFLTPLGTLHFPTPSLGLFELLYPKPDLLILGTGRNLWMPSRETRKYLSEELGIKVDVMDTANAAAAYNLLSTERGMESVAALLVPEGWKGR